MFSSFSFFQLFAFSSGFLLLIIIYLFVSHLVSRQKNRQQRSILRKLNRVSFLIVLVGYILIIFGYQIQSLRFAMVSVLGLIAIGFVAVWSILSNIICAIILFVTKPFVIDSHIRFLHAKIEGRVDEITLFFTILEDKKGNLIHIPNNAIFQKEFVHVIEKKRTKI